MNKKYLITGGQGFIGNKIVKKTGGISFDIKSGLDILNRKKLEKAIKCSSGIFHCAAKISVSESFIKKDIYKNINVDGTKNVSEIGEKYSLKVVFSSSAAIYGESSNKLNEFDKLNPKSPYAENKRDAENILSKSTVPSIILRYFNVYGPCQSIEYAGVITNFILKALKDENLNIYGNGKQTRDFIFIDDIIEANIKAMKYKNSSLEIFNIGYGKGITIENLAKIILKLTDSKSKIIH